MSEVKRIVAKGLQRELKDFAFEQSHDFQAGHVTAISQQKEFYLPTDPVFGPDGDISLPFRTTTLGFRATRMREKIRKHPVYTYSLFSAASRSIELVPDHVIEELVADDEEDTVEELQEAGIDGLSETMTITLETSDYEIGKIEVGHAYDISLADRPIYERDDTEILYSVPGQFIDMPALESPEGTVKRFVDEPISHEALAPVDRVIDEIAFRAIIDPFNTNYAEVINFHEAADQMRAIMDTLRDGRNVARFYDLR